jgi:hypothetical protein
MNQATGVQCEVDQLILRRKPDSFLFADKPGTDRVGKHLGVYRDQFEKWMDGLMEWEATEKQCPASILRTAC